MLVYPAILHGPGASGGYGVVVPDFLLNSGGPDANAALEDAVRSMEEVLLEFDRAGEPFPEPSLVEDLDLDGGLLVMISVRTPVTA